MSNKKNIDRLFQEKFKDFEVTPNDAVWNRISESLPNKKKKRRVIALWWQIGGVAAAIVLLLTVGVSVFNDSTTENQNAPIVDIENRDGDTIKSTPENNNESETDLLQTQQEELKSLNKNKTKVAVTDNTENPESLKSSNFNNKISKNPSANKATKINPTNRLVEHTEAQEKIKDSKTTDELIKRAKNDATAKVAINNKDKSKTIQKDNSAVITENDMKAVIKNELDKTKEAVADNKVDKTETSENDSKLLNKIEDDKTILVEDINKQSIEDAIAANNKTTNEKEKDKQNRWSIAPNVAPVYFSSLGQGSPVHSQFNQNAKSSDINMSYGIAGTYAINKRLKVRAGVNRVNLNYTTSDVIGFIGSEAVSRGVSAQFENLDLSSGVQSVSLVSSSMMNRATMPEAFNTQFVGDLDQQFGFIEVPLELEYKLIDKRFGLNFIGGFSTFFLSENEIYADINGSSTMIGEANNINSTSFSANLGLGLDYSLSKQWNFNLEPTFKYQLNTFNNTSGNFRPFFIGVYTGLSFKF
ncbi:hypothetical protein [Winogradskyella alexanderae]|uniref:Outer membrane protein beta-barrel domain-containing protein n=1 Tax=Winogradskyella alexanderae TaxID=2877123 RepID=A0ABS7XMV2_9FLAO|nr:hypothetical protein [Winogradskyella alexanderae]MCA0131345.1 hypothetical protein [Winogradskyella alexanderae]